MIVSHCVNCGKNDVKLHPGMPICEECYKSFPGSEEELQEMCNIFYEVIKDFKKDLEKDTLNP